MVVKVQVGAQVEAKSNMEVVVVEETTSVGLAPDDPSTVSSRTASVRGSAGAGKLVSGSTEGATKSNTTGSTPTVVTPFSSTCSTTSVFAPPGQPTTTNA